MPLCSKSPRHTAALTASASGTPSPSSAATRTKARRQRGQRRSKLLPTCNCPDVSEEAVCACARLTADDVYPAGRGSCPPGLLHFYEGGTLACLQISIPRGRDRPT